MELTIFIDRLAGLVMKELKKHKFKPKILDMKYHYEDPKKEFRSICINRTFLNRRRYVCHVTVHEEHIEVRGGGCADCHETFNIMDPEFLDKIVYSVKWMDSHDNSMHNETCIMTCKVRRSRLTKGV